MRGGKGPAKTVQTDTGHRVPASTTEAQVVLPEVNLTLGIKPESAYQAPGSKPGPQASAQRGRQHAGKESRNLSRRGQGE